jgi:hypothetical protein
VECHDRVQVCGIQLRSGALVIWLVIVAFGPRFAGDDPFWRQSHALSCQHRAEQRKRNCSSLHRDFREAERSARWQVVIVASERTIGGVSKGGGWTRKGWGLLGFQDCLLSLRLLAYNDDLASAVARWSFPGHHAGTRRLSRDVTRDDDRVAPGTRNIVRRKSRPEP